MIRPKVEWVEQHASRVLKSGETVHPMEGWVAQIEMLEDDHRAALLAGAWAMAKDMEGYARAHAPWTDRTGNARRNLHGFAGVTEGDCWCATIEHGPSIDYGVWLETRWNGKYAIIGPTQEVFSSRVLGYIAKAVKAANEGKAPDSGD